ncbi:MAG: hypothetical protein MMC23_004382 [Stictis urceolatum]|nr:hypothetical protein [Stictis urceolata]
MTSQTSTSTPRIAIIGAGPAGCTLARLLHIAGVPSTIFEGDTSFNARAQGGTLDLHEHTGQEALRAAGLHKQFLSRSRRDGDAFKVCDKRMRPLLNLGSTADGSWFAQGKPEIDRLALRQMLLDSLPAHLIRWGHRLKTIEEGRNGGTLVFENGAEEWGFDLVVGADGVWSKVRPVLSEVKPQYCGLGGFTANISQAAICAPEVSELVNRGSWFNFGDGNMILGQQMDNGSVYITAWRRLPEDWQKQATYDIYSGHAVKQAMYDEFDDWSSGVLKLLSAMDDEGMVPRSLYILPPDFTWEPRAGYTLLGDAAHVMSSFAGEGVNAAMFDALELARSIMRASNGENGFSITRVHQNVAAYERNMFTRVHGVMKKSEDMMKYTMFTPGAPEKTIEKYVLRAISDDMGPVMLWMYTAMVYVIYFFYKMMI